MECQRGRFQRDLRGERATVPDRSGPWMRSTASRVLDSWRRSRDLACSSIFFFFFGIGVDLAVRPANGYRLRRWRMRESPVLRRVADGNLAAPSRQCDS